MFWSYSDAGSSGDPIVLLLNLYIHTAAQMIISCFLSASCNPAVPKEFWDSNS